MSLGTCRHCGAPQIATDALECRVCRGWKPNPGLVVRIGAALGRITALVCLVGGTLCVLYCGLSPSVPDDAKSGSMMFSGFVALAACVSYVKSIIYPYGRPPL